MERIQKHINSEKITPSMTDYLRLEWICNKLLEIRPSEWENDGNMYVEMNGFRFYLNPHLNTETDELRFVTLEIKEVCTGKLMESYGSSNGLPFSTYQTITDRINTLKLEQEEHSELATGKRS